MSATEKDKLSTTMRIDLLAEAGEDEEKKESVRIRPATRRRIRKVTITRGERPPTQLGDRDFQEILQSVYDGSLITRLDGSIVDANARAVKFLGRSREVLCQQNIADVISGSDDSLLETIKHSLESDRFILIQAFCLRQDGSLFPTEISVNRLHLSGKVYLCFFVRDITHRKNVEERLRTGYNAIQNAGNGIAVADSNGTLKFVNPALVALWGFQRNGELLGRNLRVFVCHEAEAEEVIAAVARQETWVGEIEGIRKDGSTLFMQVSAAPNLDSENQLVGMVLSFLDITQRKRAEEEVNMVVRELKRSNAELEQFAYVVSHDLQEPLRKVTTFGSLLRAKCGNELADEGLDYLTRMEGAARRMQDLIKALLTLSRVSTKAKPFAKVSLDEAVAGVVSDLEARIYKTAGTVEVGTLPVIDAERVQMRQLFQNLIGNALKFHRDGVPPVVKVNCDESEDGRSKVGGERGSRYCHLIVEDNGIGFDEEHLDRIFGVFQRLHRREAYEGTGIGLAICKKIAERHHGRITASSTPGEGTRFSVFLPYDQVSPETAEGGETHGQADMRQQPR